MSVIHAPQEPELDVRQLAFIGLIGVALMVLLVRLWYLQVVESENLIEKASTIRTVEVPKLAPRGMVYDRKKRPVATVTSKLVVTAIPSEVKKNPWVLAKVAAMVGAPVDKLEDKVKAGEWRKHFPTPIFVGTTIETATKIAEAGDYLPGIGVETQAMRTYPDTIHFSHILGYVWIPSGADLTRIKESGVEEPADYVGKDGLERIYEKDLMGVEGYEKHEVDARRRPTRTVERKAPQPGSKLILGLDAELQKIAYEQLRGRKGAVVALDPKTGEILCLASGPSYDASLFDGGISSKDWKMLNGDKDHPLVNRAISSAYAPGSTFKIVTTIASILAGQFTTSRSVYCPGYYQVGRRKVKCENHRPGSVAFHLAFEKSCNTYFATLGDSAGMENLEKAASITGFGKRTHIDLPAESKGLYPTAEWIAAVQKRNPEYRWYRGNTINVCIGQGEVNATPLQMACLAALVANEGISYEPRLVKAMIPPGNEQKPVPTERKVLSQVEAPPEMWRELKGAMVDVIQRGTGRAAQIPGITWGGKTGSAEHRKGQKTHGWFVGIAPMDDPKIVIAVLIEAAGHGGTVAAPVAKEIVKAYLLPESARKVESKSANAAETARTSGSPSNLPVVR
jgi:penicillin-binding protein 2